MQEVFKLAVAVLHWPPEYVLDDMSLEVFTLALEGHVDILDPDRAKKMKNSKPPDMEFTMKLVEALNKSKDGN